MISSLLALLTGITLGLLGAGGSILTVPILIYIVKIDPKSAIALSLGIVAISSFIGVFKHFSNKNIDLKIAMIFSPVAMIGSFTGAQVSSYLSSSIQLSIFSIIMISASVFMLRNKRNTKTKAKVIKNSKLITISLIVGFVTGIVGVGGGFLIAPALSVLGNVDIKKSIGTSLLIISLNSITGFLGHYSHVVIDWNFLFLFSFFSTVGVFIGARIVKKISTKNISKIFAYFLGIIGILILYKNLII
jgi:uncharacterized membrane protein YfcA